MTGKKQLPKLLDEFVVRPASLNDVQAMVNLVNTCSAHTVGIKMTDVDEYENEWQMPGFNLDEDTRLVFSADGQLIGAVEVWTVRNPPVHPWVWARVHPDYEGRGLGTYLTTWGENRARDAIARCPENARVSMRCGVDGGYALACQHLENHGMSVVRYFWDMEIEFSAEPTVSPLPEGISIQTYNHPQELKKAYTAFDDAFKDHWGHVDEAVEAGVTRWKQQIEGDKHFDKTLWFLAMDGDEIAAVSLCRPKIAHNPKMGWVDILGVRKPWRKKGLGLAILQHSFKEFYKRGQKFGGLAVDAASLTGATRLYEKAGMHAAREYTDYELELRAGEELQTE